MAATHHLPPSKRYQQSVSDSSSSSLANNMTFLQNPSLTLYASNSPSSSFGVAVNDRSSSRGRIRHRPSSMVNCSLQVPASLPNLPSFRGRTEHQSTTKPTTDSVNVRGLNCALVSKRISNRQDDDSSAQMEAYEDVAEGEGMSEEEDDDEEEDEDDDDDDDEEDDEDEEDDDEDGEASRGEPTPTNETTASDEFEWVRGSPMLTNLMQQEKKEKEQCQKRSKILQRPRSNITDNASDGNASNKNGTEKPAGLKSHCSGCDGEIHGLPVIAKNSSSGKTRSRSQQHREIDYSVRNPKKSNRSTGDQPLQRIKQPVVPVVRRREDYLVIGGENESSSSSFPSDAQVSENLSTVRHSHSEVNITGCATAHCQHHYINPHVQTPQGTCVALSLPPPPPLPMSFSQKSHWDDNACTCSYENLLHFPPTSSELRCLTPGASGSKTLPCYFRSRTPQAYLSAPSPPASDRECLRPRARSHSRVPRRRKRNFGDLESRNLSCSCNCPYNHFRDLALEYMQWRSFFKVMKCSGGCGVLPSLFHQFFLFLSFCHTWINAMCEWQSSAACYS